MARKSKKGMFGWILVLAVLALAGFGAYKLIVSPDGKQVVRAVESGGKAAVKAYRTSSAE